MSKIKKAIKSRWKFSLILLAVVGPGLITSIVDNDAGGITTYSIAGAHFGYTLIWSLIPVTFVLIIIQEMIARMGVVTGKGLSDLIREKFGLKVTFVLMLLMFIANLSIIVSNFAGIAAASQLFHLSKYLVVPLIALGIWVAIIKLNYKAIEKVFLLLCLFYIAYIFSGFLAQPDWSLATKELFTPHFSWDMSYIVILIGIIGTTITPWMQFYLQSTIVEKGVQIKDYKYTRMEVIIGSIITDIIAFFIIIACAATLFKSGIHIETATDAARALIPFAGEYAGMLFGVGLFAASLAAAFIIPLATSFQICEGMGWESSLNRKFKEAPQFYGILAFLILVGAGVTLIPHAPLLKIIITSQVINGIALPFLLIYILKLINDKKLMGEHVNSRFYNGVCYTTVVGIIILSGVMFITPFLGVA
ncbi:MAG: Nramp family divalent metal transporter [Nanoarchaeota archaeon]|nr:Nramp family divalent metal transporter [Nanoarchaeota archaeon]